MKIKKGKVTIEGKPIGYYLKHPFFSDWTEKRIGLFEIVASDLYSKGKTESPDYQLLQEIVGHYWSLKHAIEALRKAHDLTLKEFLESKEEINND